MNRSRCCQHTRYCHFLLVIGVQLVGNVFGDFKNKTAAVGENESVDDDHMPIDFANFINSLGSVVYNKQYTIPGSVDGGINTARKDTRRAFLKSNEGDGAMSDLLMLKLVSYYEDKYKVAPRPPEMEPIPEMLPRKLVTPISHRNDRSRTPSKRISAARRFMTKTSESDFMAHLKTESQTPARYQHQSSPETETTRILASEEDVLYL